MTLPPIAVIGRACVLPGALGPGELWTAVREGHDLVSTAPEGRWRLAKDDILCSPDGPFGDHTWTDRGGYVRGFEEVFDPEGFAIPAAQLLALDRLFQWTLHCGREALRDAGYLDCDDRRVGAILGNLSFPSAGMARFAETTWIRSLPGLGEQALRGAGLDAVDPRNRFMSSLPALLLAQALRLQGGAFALDAACASSLYAIKLACDRLHDGRADLMLAGAVNCADDLFIHVGFCALNAMSHSGRSQPFSRHADGLVPAEGAALVVLKRLDEAVRDGDTVHGVLRGIGLANDGRGKGLLAPARVGQVQAIRRAYQVAGLTAETISLLECHATGTQVGDTTEIESTGEVFKGLQGVPIGSLKSNLGHLITAAGVAGLIKVMAAMHAGERPPTLHVEEPISILQDSPFRVLQEVEPWPADGPRRAAVSAFGFGGNNAHLIVEQYLPENIEQVARPTQVTCPLAVVGIGACVADCSSRDELIKALDAAETRVRKQEDGSRAAPASEISLSMAGIRFPPADLKQTLPQQLLLLRAAREAVADSGELPQQTAVFVGMETDAEVARYGARWRLAEWARRWGCDQEWLSRAQDGVVAELAAAGVVGTMPNIPANRLSSLLDLVGPSFTVAAAEASGLIGLDLAARGLASEEIDAALVGAVDLSCEPVHQEAARQLLPGDRQIAGDAAVVVVLKRLADARRDKDRVYAVIEGVGEVGAEVAGGAAMAESGVRLGLAEGAQSLVEKLGHAHAACGLVYLVAAALTVSGDLEEKAGQAQVDLVTMDGSRHKVSLSAPPAKLSLPQEEPAAPEESRLMSFPAHLAPVRMPPLPKPDAVRFVVEAVVNRAPDPDQVQVMDPAPWLAPVCEVLEVGPSPDSAAVAAANVEAVKTEKVLAEARHYQEQIAELHRQYMAGQARLHQQYLSLQSRAVQHLVEGCRSAVGSQAWPPTPAAAATRDQLRQPTSSGMGEDEIWGREALRVHASGQISELFGDLFAEQDQYDRQVRMPEPPLLLADRVTALKAEPGSMGLGLIRTETDVREDAWYLHNGSMPAGIMIESGQADLMLISYLGIDLLNRGERVYRLLGCQLTYHGELPRPGETLCYQIEVDGHARQGDVRLFFFHYDCKVDGELRLSVREGQAGFFSDHELADSAGILWRPEDAEPSSDPRLDPPEVECAQQSFSAEQVEAFAQGRPWDCFGADFEYTKTHSRTPSIQSGPMLFLEQVTELDAQGGPWQRGYLRAETAISPDDWYFEGHFKNDPCMPGTLMFEGCLQAMAFYLAGLGFTISRDGWRFQLVPDEAYDLRCRGQVDPGSRKIVYEVFVEELHDGPVPTLYADLLCTVDGLKAFHARRIGLQLVPDWPLSSRPELLEPKDIENRMVAESNDGFRFDYASLLASAWGRPSHAFGPMYMVFDGPRRVARLPGPPYHFMSRVTRINGEIGSLEAGAGIELEYDIPAEAWYFDENGSRTMPFCVLLEVALQPCGWLASYVGSTTTSSEDLFFRNLDGTGCMHREVRPGEGTLRSQVTIDKISRTGGMIIESFSVATFLGDELVYEHETVFGFFPRAALENQKGLPASQDELLTRQSNLAVDLTFECERYWSGPLHPARPRLLMLDRVTGFWPEGGGKGLGALRAEKDVDPAEWFFKAHFFQDPVQPGSLGIEAMVQLLQLYMLEAGMHHGIDNPRFEPLALQVPLTWKYRGQVVPGNQLITTTMEIVDRGSDERGLYAIATASLWVDGKRIYEAANLGMRIISG
jgi:3-oxoacyl-(acyl-carrier-protein) synthase/3-hydroxymyristoyl/3-hydroxydecanoyl-(acyl carrier protein) dehydratase